MITVNDKILVRCELNQKSSVKFGDIEFQSAGLYDKNYREKSPVVATVIKGNGSINDGDVLICHHNLFYLPSPHHLYGDFFSIKASGTTLFAKILEDGSLNPILGNIFCSRIDIETTLPLPPEQRTQYINRVKVIDGGDTEYKPGQIIFHRPNAAYEIVYNVNGNESRVFKIPGEQICGVIV